MASGALVQYRPHPRSLVYLIVVGLLAACAAIVAAGPETVQRTDGALASLRP
jgi:hypothetical protein